MLSCLLGGHYRSAWIDARLERSSGLELLCIAIHAADAIMRLAWQGCVRWLPLALLSRRSKPNLDSLPYLSDGTLMRIC